MEHMLSVIFPSPLLVYCPPSQLELSSSSGQFFLLAWLQILGRVLRAGPSGFAKSAPSGEFLNQASGFPFSSIPRPGKWFSG